MQIDIFLAFYALPLVAIWTAYVALRGRAEARAVAQREVALRSGLGEPASLHPVIDQTLCIGCKACLSACPEGDILGLINNKAELIEPSNCIGHGACKAACPRGAISLVFGTETRGVELPLVRSDFQTNVAGIYIAGELGGMGLIRNAIEQGRQAMKSIASEPRLPHNEMLDVVIVGGGPAGLSASLEAIEKKLKFVTIEQGTFGGTVAHYPRSKVVMTAPAVLPIVGKVKFREIGKEDLIAFWKSVAARTGLRIHFKERVDRVVALEGGFAVQTTKQTYLTRRILLAIGRRGTPRRLGIPGEELPKVAYQLIDPEQYRGRHILVVGGGDSALEAAATLAEQPGTHVTLSYRDEAFARAKVRNRERVEAAQVARRLDVLLGSTVAEIGVDQVRLNHRGKETVRRNDSVIICIGGILPTDFLRSMGIAIETKYGTA